MQRVAYFPFWEGVRHCYRMTILWIIKRFYKRIARYSPCLMLRILSDGRVEVKTFNNDADMMRTFWYGETWELPPVILADEDRATPQEKTRRADSLKRIYDAGMIKHHADLGSVKGFGDLR